MAEAARPRPVDLGPVADTLGFLLRLAQLDVFADFYAVFEGESSPAIRPGEATVLMLIGLNPGVRQGVLASELRIKRAHMTKMIRGIEDAGLVERSVPADDRRAIELRLSEAGAARVAGFRERFLSHDKDCTHRLTPGELAELKRLLSKLLGLRAEGSL